MYTITDLPDATRISFPETETLTCLLMSDVHFDSKDCDRKLLFTHLDQAKEMNAPVLIFGDFFDCMQGKYDPRHDKDNVRPEYQGADYFDRVVDDAVHKLRDYPIHVVSQGNHELSVLKRHETNLTKRFAQGVGARHGKYSGWVRFSAKNATENDRDSINLMFHHGFGGNAPVSKGQIIHERLAAMIMANIYVTGHNHQCWVMYRTRRILTAKGSERLVNAAHINLSTYKKQGEWDEMKGYGPAVRGACWLRLEVVNHIIQAKGIVAF